MNNIDFYGLKLTNFRTEEIIDYIDTTISKDQSKIIFGWGFAQIPVIREHDLLFENTNNSDIMLCDGTNLYNFVKLMGFELGDFLSIPNAVNLSIKQAVLNNYSIYLLGGTSSINDKAINNLRKKYPNLTIDGRNGYFNEEEEDLIMEKINRFRPNILLIGISSPIKESFAIKMRANSIGNVIIPCGGMIDIIAEKTKQTPEWLKKVGLAMFFRILQEPRRLFKSGMIFIYEVIIRIIPNIIYSNFRENKDFNLKGLYIKDD